MKIVMQISQDCPILQNISTTEQVFTNVFSFCRCIHADYKTDKFCSSPRDIAMVTNQFWAIFADVKINVFALCSRVLKQNALSSCGCMH